MMWLSSLSPSNVGNQLDRLLRSLQITANHTDSSFVTWRQSRFDGRYYGAAGDEIAQSIAQGADVEGVRSISALSQLSSVRLSNDGNWKVGICTQFFPTGLR